MSLNEQQCGPPEVLKEPNTVQNCWKQHWTWVTNPCGCTSNGHFTHLKVFNVFNGNRLGHCNPWILTYAFLLQAAEPESGWIWSSFNPTFSVRKTQTNGIPFSLHPIQSGAWRHPDHTWCAHVNKGQSFVQLKKLHLWRLEWNKWCGACGLESAKHKFQKNLSLWTWLSCVEKLSSGRCPKLNIQNFFVWRASLVPS